MTAEPELVWYVSYGSNMNADRLNCYLTGGTAPGAHRAHPGCRDPRPPRRVISCALAGGVYFATRSPVWGGGRAFFDPELPGTAPARAYLITPGQFADIAAQEMYRHPGENLDLAEVLASGRVELGPGRYETLLHVGNRQGHPLLTFTAPWHASDVPHIPPSPAYLRMLTPHRLQSGDRLQQKWPESAQSASSVLIQHSSVGQAVFAHGGAEDGDLSAAFHLEFGEQAGDVVLDGLLRQVEPGADLPVGQTVGNQRQHRTLPIRQHLEPGIGGRRALPQPGEHVRRDSGVQQ